jgi:hypothetical protein
MIGVKGILFSQNPLQPHFSQRQGHKTAAIVEHSHWYRWRQVTRAALSKRGRVKKQIPQ